jgi:hypothetical protein
MFETLLQDQVLLSMQELKVHLDRLKKMPERRPCLYKMLKHEIAVDVAREEVAEKTLLDMQQYKAISLSALANLICIPGFESYRRIIERPQADIEKLLKLSASDIKQLESTSKAALLDKYVLMELIVRKSLSIDLLKAEREAYPVSPLSTSESHKRKRKELTNKIVGEAYLLSGLNKGLVVMEKVLRQEAITLDERARLSGIKGFHHYQDYSPVNYLSSDFEEFTDGPCALQ